MGLDGRAWTDLLTNATQIAPHDDAEDPRPWLAPLPTFAPHYGAFLHEVTHHWCFDSPVGWATLAVSIRAALSATTLMVLGEEDYVGRFPRRKPGLPEQLRRLHEYSIGLPDRADLATRHDRKRVLDALVQDVIRAETAIRLLRPIAEGLALFAEFDATTRDKSRVESPLVTATIGYFCGRERFAKQEMFIEPYTTTALYHGSLGRLRTDPETLARKASLLLKPMDSKAGGYLLGYLVVKSMWRTACNRNPRLWGETDLFLVYLRAYFYNDPVLADAILDGRGSDGRVAQRIAQRILDRVCDFTGPTEEELAALEEAIDSPTPGTAPVAGLRIGPDDDTAAEHGRIVGDKFAAVIQECVGHELAGLPIIPDLPRIAARRTLLTVCSVPVGVAPAEDGAAVVRWRGQEVLRIDPADQLVRLQATGARLEVVTGLFDAIFDRAVFLSVDGRAVACVPITYDPDRGAVRERMLHAYHERDRSVRDAELLRWISNVVVEDDSGARMDLEFILDWVDGMPDQMYQDIALRYANGYDAIDACAEALRGRGFAPLLRSSRLVRGMAMLGLAAGMTALRSGIADVFAGAGLDLEDTLRGLRECHETYGFPPPPDEWDDRLFQSI